MSTPFLNLAEQRFSVRKYSDKEIEQSKIDAILKAAQLAPTATNAQPQQIFVLRSEESRKKAAKVTPYS